MPFNELVQTFHHQPVAAAAAAANIGVDYKNGKKKTGSTLIALTVPPVRPLSSTSKLRVKTKKFALCLEGVQLK